MTRFTRFFNRTAALLAVSSALLLGAAGCASSRVGVTSDFDHSINFREYKTWAWYPDQLRDTEGGPAQGYQSFLDQRIRAAVEREMTAKGLTRTDATPDIYVAYSARVEDKQQANYGGYGPYSPYYRYGYGGLYNPGYITNYKAGTVIIDVVDARRKQLAWRGQGQAQVDKQTISEPEVYRIVNSVLGAFPPTDPQVRR